MAASDPLRTAAARDNLTPAADAHWLCDLKTLGVTMADISITSIGGLCPVQAEGTINGVPFYFRARHQHWLLAIGGEDPVDDPEWEYEEHYSDVPSAAGYMTEDEARQFISAAAERFERGEPERRSGPR